MTAYRKQATNDASRIAGDLETWNIIVDADPKIPKPLPIPPANTDDDFDWDARVKAATDFKIHWSESEQKYFMK